MKKQEIIQEIEAIELEEVTEQEIIETLFPKRIAFYQEYKRRPFHITCTKCGHDWDAPSLERQAKCPHCKCKIVLEKASKNRRNWCTDRLIACKIEAHGDYQFVRWFCGQLFGTVGKPEQIGRDTYETHRYVFDKNGEEHLLRREIWQVMYNWWFNGSTPIKHHKVYQKDYWFGMNELLGTPTYTEAFRYARIGKDLEWGDWLSTYMRPFAKRDGEKTRFLETITQIGKRRAYYNFLSHLNIFDGKAEWGFSHAKLILKGFSNGYKLDHEWGDNIKDLETLGRPLTNENVFPKDMESFRTKIQKAVDKRRRETARKEMLEQEKKQLEKDIALQPKYEQKHKKFFDVEIRQKGFVIIPLKSIREFYNEGIAMNHCVFRCAYYKQDELQIYSVRDEKTNERIETLSIDTKAGKVQQCYGHSDKTTKFHDDIIAIAKENMAILAQKKQRGSATA